MIQGVCLTWLYSRMPRQGHPGLSGVKSSLAGAPILFGYITAARASVQPLRPRRIRGM